MMGREMLSSLASIWTWGTQPWGGWGCGFFWVGGFFFWGWFVGGGGGGGVGCFGTPPDSAPSGDFTRFFPALASAVRSNRRVEKVISPPFNA